MSPTGGKGGMGCWRWADGNNVSERKGADWIVRKVGKLGAAI
jgi:hypothetical protein